MSRKLNDLQPEFRSIVFEFLARLVEAGIPVLIVDTLRTVAEQNEYIKRGVSWTNNSKHLTGLAIDVCPYYQWNLYGPDKLQWNNADPTWAQIGFIGESLGLVWGGRWKVKDMGHFEMVYNDDSKKV